LVRNGILETNIIIEVGSAANEIKNRPGFQNLIQNVLKEGDTLVVTKIDRCARNTLEFLKLQGILFKRKIQFISLDLPYSEDLNINKLISITPIDIVLILTLNSYFMLLPYDSDIVNIITSYIKYYIRKQYTNNFKINQYPIFF